MKGIICSSTEVTLLHVRVRLEVGVEQIQEQADLVELVVSRLSFLGLQLVVRNVEAAHNLFKSIPRHDLEKKCKIC